MKKSFEQLTIENTVAKLFAGNYFDICAVDNLGKMLGRNPEQHRNYKFLRSLHCVNYRDMDPQLVEQLELKVAECLSGNLFNPARVLHAITDEGGDFAFTEDRYLDRPARRIN